MGDLEVNVEDDESLPPSLAVSFLHAVGPSTVRQGLTVPVMAQISWLTDIRKGDSVPVTIEFGHGTSVPATLRRINNAVGHLQFRYESRTQAPLRDYLGQLFGMQADCDNAVLRITEIRPRTFLFEPVATGPQKTAHLSICQPYFQTKIEPTYSGMMSLEKAIRELPFLQFMLTTRTVIAGIEIQSA